MKKLLMCLGLLLAYNGAEAKKFQGVEFEDNTSIMGTTLKLNGTGLRTVQRFGLSIRVYVAGLYLVEESSDAESIIKSESPKYLKMVFLRGVDKEDLVKAWKDGMKANCIKAECEEATTKLEEFNKLMVDSKNKGTIDIQFHPDKVIMKMDGRGDRSGTIDGAVFSRNLLAVFIGTNPPTADFKQGLMGLKN